MTAADVKVGQKFKYKSSGEIGEIVEIGKYGQYLIYFKHLQHADWYTKEDIDKGLEAVR